MTECVQLCPVSPSLCLDCHFVGRRTAVFLPAVWTRLLLIPRPCSSRAHSVVTKPPALWELVSLPQCLLFSVCVTKYLFIRLMHTRTHTTTPYLEVMLKRIMWSWRNAFVKWIISDWQGFCQIVDTPNILFKYWCLIFCCFFFFLHEVWVDQFVSSVLSAC